MLIQADARRIPLADGCVQTIVTSPPYWGLRDYGVAGRPGDLVFDPFGGSGTVVRVACRLNRRGVMLDLNPQYLQLAQNRISGVQVSLLESAHA